MANATPFRKLVSDREILQDGNFSPEMPSWSFVSPLAELSAFQFARGKCFPPRRDSEPRTGNSGIAGASSRARTSERNETFTASVVPVFSICILPRLNLVSVGEDFAHPGEIQEERIQARFDFGRVPISFP